jgi:CDP-4-dehydro-6-deoxyglucose reductase, E3
MIITLLPQRRAIAADSALSILEHARRAGINLPHSCRGGRCGSCKARLVAGSVQPLMLNALGLSPEERARGEILLCQTVAVSDLQIEAKEVTRVDQIELKRLPVRVAQLRHWGDDLLGVYLKLPAVEQFAFRAGQYVDLILPDGQRRSYSLASPPHDATTLELHIRKVSGGTFTEKLFEYLKPNALLEIEGPLGEFAANLTLNDEPLLLVAGGTGFAPIKSLMRAILETRPTGPVTLYWGVRTLADAYDLDWLNDYAKRFEQLSFVIAVSDVKPAQAPYQFGLVHEVIAQQRPALAATKAIAAGPPVMLEALIGTLPELGLDLNNLILDSQGARLSPTAQAQIEQARQRLA